MGECRMLLSHLTYRGRCVIRFSHSSASDADQIKSSSSTTTAMPSRCDAMTTPGLVLFEMNSAKWLGIVLLS